jgi:transposase InsO family protein
MGPEFVAKAVRDWLGRIGVKTLYIEPGSPWENGYHESFNSKLREELLNGEIFTTLRPAALLAWLSSAGAGNDLAASVGPALRCAPASSSACH